VSPINEFALFRMLLNVFLLLLLNPLEVTFEFFEACFLYRRGLCKALEFFNLFLQLYVIGV